MEENRRLLQESFNKFVADWNKKNPCTSQSQKLEKPKSPKKRKLNHSAQKQEEEEKQKQKQKQKQKSNSKKSVVSKNKKRKKKKEVLLIAPGQLYNQHGITKSNLHIYRVLSDGDNCHNIGATTALLESLLQTVINLECKQFGILLIVDVYEKPPLFVTCLSNLNNGKQNLDGTPMVHFLPAIVCDFLVLVYPYGKHPTLSDWNQKKAPSGKAYPYRAMERKTFTDFLGNQRKRVKLQRKKIAAMKPYMLPRRAGFLFEVNSLRGRSNAWTRIAGAKANATERDKLCVDETFSVVDTCFFLLKLILKCHEYGGSDLSLLVQKVPPAFPSWWNILIQHRKTYANRDDFYSEKTCFDKKEEEKEEEKEEDEEKKSRESLESLDNVNSPFPPCRTEPKKGNKEDINHEALLQRAIREAAWETQEAQGQGKPDNNGKKEKEKVKVKVKEKETKSKSSDQTTLFFPTILPLFEEFDAPQDVPQPKLSISDQNSPENIWYKQLFVVGQGIGSQGALAIMNFFKYGNPAIDNYKREHGEEALIQKIGNLRRLENLKTFGIEKGPDHKQEQFKEGKKIGVETAKRFVRALYSVQYNPDNKRS